jgi:hypothetical protein
MIHSGANAADLKFLLWLPQARQEFKIESGISIIKMLVPFGFRSSCQRCRDV